MPLRRRRQHRLERLHSRRACLSPSWILVRQRPWLLRRRPPFAWTRRERSRAHPVAAAAHSQSPRAPPAAHRAARPQAQGKRLPLRALARRTASTTATLRRLPIARSDLEETRPGRGSATGPP
eukprot:3871777-Pleurochrysis_carterae.AAC.2